MAGDYTDTDAFRGARFTDADLRGAQFRSCDLRGVKIVDAWLTDINVSGLIGNFRVNDVDIAPLVDAELDRRHPERVQLRSLSSPDDYRAMWATIEGLWADTVARARRLPEPLLYERVDDEWSFVETLRHLIYATDAWASRTILDEPLPYAPLALPQSSYPRDDMIAIGIDPDAHPTLDEVLTVRAGRVALVRGIVANLTDTDLPRQCTRTPAPGYPEEPRSVAQCLRVIMTEETEHHRYTTRDLPTLEAR